MRSRFHKPLSLFLCSLVLYISFHVYLPFPNTQSPAIAQSAPQPESDLLLQQGIQLYETADYEAALKKLQQALTLYQQHKDKRGEVKVYETIAAIYIELTTDKKTVEDSLQKALKISQELQDSQLLASVFMHFGRFYLTTGEDAKAQEYAQRSLKIARSINDRTTEAWALLVLSGVYQFAPNGSEKAIELSRQALALAQQLNDKRLEGRLLWRVGSVLQDQEKYSQAIEAYQKLVPISQAVRDRRNLVITLLNIGQSYKSLKQYNGAIQALELALPLSEALPIPYLKFQVPLELGLAYSEATPAQPEKAFQVYQIALKAGEQYGNLDQQYSVWFAIAAYYSRKQDYQKALKARETALEIAKKLNNPKMIAEAYQRIGAAAGLVKDFKAAQTYLEHAIELYRKESDRESRKNEAEALVVLGNTLHQLNQSEKALNAYQQALDIARSINEQPIQANALFGLAGASVNDKNIDLSIGYLQQSLAIQQTLPDQTLVLDKLLLLTSRYNAKASNLQARGFASQAKAEIPNALKYAEESLALARKLKQQQAEAKALNELGHSYEILGDYPKAIDFLKQGVDLARASKAADVEQASLNIFNVIYQRQGNLREKIKISLRNVEVAIEIGKKRGNQLSEVYALAVLAGDYQGVGELPQSVEIFQQALAIVRKTNLQQLPLYLREGAQQAELLILDGLKNSYAQLGKLEEEFQVAQERVRAAQSLKSPEFEAYALLSLASSYQNSANDYSKSIETAQQALLISQQIKNPNLQVEVLQQLSKSYLKQRNNSSAVEYATQALEISDGQGNDELRLRSLVLLLDIYDKLGEYPKAIQVANSILTHIYKPIDLYTKAVTLIGLSNYFRQYGDYKKAKQVMEEGIEISRNLNNRFLKFYALNSMGQLYSFLQQFQKALEVAQQSLEIAQDLKAPFAIESVQITIASIHQGLGDYAGSRRIYQQQIESSRQKKDLESEGHTLLLLALNAFSEGRGQDTVDLSQQALSIFRKINAPGLTNLVYRTLSLGYGELGQDKEAMETAQAFLTFAQKVKSPVFEKQALTLIASLHRKFGRSEQAIDTYQQALAIPSDSQVVGADSSIYAGLGRVHRDRNQPTIAITYYKQAIDKIETVRRGIEGLPPELQITFLQSTVDFDRTKTSDIYRQLADLLISQGRLGEAQEVLELLKAQEIRDFTRQTRSGNDRRDVSYSDLEKDIIKQHGSLIAFGETIYRCSQEKTVCTEQKKQQKRLRDEFAETQRKIEEQARSQPDKLAIKGRSDFSQGAAGIVEPPGTVLIYPFLLEDKLRILWASRGGILKSSPSIVVSRDQLWNTVAEFRNLLQDPNSQQPQLKAKANQLYKWLIAPIAEDLTKGKATHLVFSLDSATRYIPMGALYDGNRYLSEQYSISSINEIKETDTKDKLKPAQDISVLALGVSKRFGGFPQLDNVPRELDAIVKSPENSQGIYSGEKLLNESFNESVLENKIPGHTIVHIATHGKFFPTRDRDSFLLLGDGKEYPIYKIENLDTLQNVHLVVLSACETALGAPSNDGTEISGISSYFTGGDQKAKAVMASLWKVDDASTSLLMQEFYRNLAKGTMTKAEALNQVQQRFIQGKLTAKDANQRGLTVQAASIDRKSADFSHPYYWSPFILIGNNQ